MQCFSCNAVYSNGLDNCPRCNTPKTKPISLDSEDNKNTFDNVHLDSVEDKERNFPLPNQTTAKPSTLIEFPKNKQKQHLPEWRKELLDKFKEIQERREREGGGKPSGDEEDDIGQGATTQIVETKKPQLEIVQSAPPTPVNPIVAAALARLEKAHSKPLLAPQTQPSASLETANLAEQQQQEQHTSKSQEQQRLALVQTQTNQAASLKTPPKVTHTTATPEVQRQDSAKPTQKQPVSANRKSPQPFVQTRSTNALALAVEHDVHVEQPVPQTSTAKVVVAEQTKEIAVKTPPVLNKTVAVTSAIELAPEIGTVEINTTTQTKEPETSALTDDSAPVYLGEHYDYYTPLNVRTVCFFFDLLVMIFAISPFAAILELSRVDWTNKLVLAMFVGISLIVSLVYLMASTLMMGRTWGMNVLSLRVIDDVTGYSPTPEQSFTRSLFFVVSIAAFGLPFLHVLFDAQGRALHDRVAGTVVVKEI